MDVLPPNHIVIIINIVVIIIIIIIIIIIDVFSAINYCFLHSPRTRANPWSWGTRGIFYLMDKNLLSMCTIPRMIMMMMMIIIIRAFESIHEPWLQFIILAISHSSPILSPTSEAIPKNESKQQLYNISRAPYLCTKVTDIFFASFILFNNLLKNIAMINVFLVPL